MKVRALLFLCICFSLYVFGQKDISGTYSVSYTHLTLPTILRV